MRQFWKRRENRADWPEPRPEFLHSLADRVSETRGRRSFPELRLAFVLVVAVALLLPLAAFAGRSQKMGARETVKAVASILQANTAGKAANRNGDDDDDDNGGGSGGGGGGGGGDDDDDDNGGGGGGGGDDDDDDNGGGGGGDDDDDGGPGYGGDDDDDDGGDDDDDNGGDDDDDNGGYDEDDDCDNFGARRSALAHHQNQEKENLRQHQNQFHPGTSSQRQRHFKEEKFALHLHQMAERQELRDECRGDDDDDDDDGGGGGGDDDDDGGGGGGGDDDDD